MKKIIYILVAIVLIMLIPARFYIGHPINVIKSKIMLDDILNIKNIDVIETKVEHGKLVGNGNNMQYRCCALIKGNIQDVEKSILHLKEKYDIVNVVLPQELKFVIRESNSPLIFDNLEFNSSGGEGYCMLYIYDENSPFLGSFDICGH